MLSACVGIGNSKIKIMIIALISTTTRKNIDTLLKGAKWAAALAYNETRRKQTRVKDTKQTAITKYKHVTDSSISSWCWWLMFVFLLMPLSLLLLSFTINDITADNSGTNTNRLLIIP